MTKGLIGIILVNILIIISCKTNNIDKRIVIKIGGLEISQYEFNKNRDRGLFINEKDSIPFKDRNKIAEWKKDFIDHCFIIEDAYLKRYDTIEILKKQIKYTGDIMMIQPYGYLWKSKISPIVDKSKELSSDKLEKRKKLFYFDIITFKNLDSLLRITNYDTILKSKDDFLKLKLNCARHKSITCSYISLNWPFLPFWSNRDYLFKLKQGEVSKLLVDRKNYMYFYLDYIEEKSLTQQEKENLQMELQLGTQTDLIKNSLAEIIATCKPEVNNKSIEIISQFLLKGFSISEFSEDIELIQYSIDNQIRTLGFKKFLEYYKFQLMRNDITDRKSLIDNVLEYYIDDYCINEAKKLDLYNSDEFLLDKKNYLNNIIYGKYIENEIAQRVKVDSLEILNYYKNNLKIFEQPKIVTFNMYTFINNDAAQRNRLTISEMLKHNEFSKTKDTSIINGLVKYTPNQEIDMESNAYSYEFKNTLLSTELNELSQFPLVYNGKYVLMQKVNEVGKCSRKIEEVYNSIESKIKNEKVEVERMAIITKLKSKYKIEFDKTGI